MFDLWTKREMKLLAGLVVCAILLVSILMYFFLNKSNYAEGDIPLEAISQEGVLPEDSDEGLVEAEDDSVSETTEIVIDVKGAVKQPGIYHLLSDARVFDAIEAAGGTTDEADTKRLNMAEFLSDGMAVVVPVEGEDPDELLQMTGGTSGDSQTGGKVNVNRADEAALQTLSGIGPAKAAAIIQDREENGAFKTVDELTRVSGIGEKTLENIRDQVTVK